MMHGIRPGQVDYGLMLDAASRREKMARKLGCQPVTIALLENVTRTAMAVWHLQYDARKARAGELR